ncbi:MAG TPA: hypothetical protein VGE93_12160 [Bryobacteraceae bacterium]
MLSTPVEALRYGTEIVSAVMKPHGFVFEFRDEGLGSGGHFAWGEFVRRDRRLELHYRRSLGLVRYHFGPQHVSHEGFMREIGALGQNRYPGYSHDPLDGFRDLTHDLQFATDFLTGSGAVLRAAALSEARADAETSNTLMAGYAGDTRDIEHMHRLFRQGEYGRVLALFERLRFPERLTEAQLRLVDIARARFR